jgi:hypothetical protein
MRLVPFQVAGVHYVGVLNKGRIQALSAPIFRIAWITKANSPSSSLAGGRNISKSAALAHIAGYSLFNDG